jgi:hypothetical protein
MDFVIVQLGNSRVRLAGFRTVNTRLPWRRRVAHKAIPWALNAASRASPAMSPDWSQIVILGIRTDEDMRDALLHVWPDEKEVSRSLPTAIEP